MPRFQALQAEESAQIQDGGLIDVTLPLVGGLVDRLRSGIDVLDVGCGHGHAANLIADAFPASRVHGHRHRRAGDRGGAFGGCGSSGSRTPPSTWPTRSISRPSRTTSSPRSTSSTTCRVPRRQCARSTTRCDPDGVYLMVDIAASSHLHENLEHPFGAALYTVSIFHCMSVSLANGGPGLGTMWGEQQALDILHGAGFGSVEVKRVEADFLNNYYIARKS